jgi:diacylglycerol kinase (ATP)
VRVIVAHNPRSGRGRAARIAASAAAALQADGHEVDPVEIGPGVERAGLVARFRAAEAVFAAGGDGTIHHLAPLLMETGTPVYHLPAGNENLFARDFGMSASPEAVRRAAALGRHTRIDTAEYALNGTRGMFLLMAGFGPDAWVIHRLAAARTRAIGHRAYIVPVLQELMSPNLPRLTVHADGEEIVRDGRGMLIIANSRQYGMRVDLAHRASLTDGLLDLVFLPCASRAGALRWTVRARLRRHETARGAIYRQAREIRVESPIPVPFQLDGECPGGDHAGNLRGSMTISVRPARLAVLATLPDEPGPGPEPNRMVPPATAGDDSPPRSP